MEATLPGATTEGEEERIMVNNVPFVIR